MNCSCLFEKHICETMKKFFLCTHIPIRAYQFDGTLIHSTGYNEQFNKLFDNNDIHGKMKDEMLEKNDTSIITISCSNNINFTGFYICPKNINRGIFIIGPYTSQKTHNTDILYKPSCCIPHLISLLYNIGKDSHYIKQRQQINEIPYSIYVKKALDYIESRYNEPITLTDISNYLNINKYYFCTIFKKETGKTFSQVLNEIRIEKSKSLLLEENLSVLDIALSVGFNNQSYYNMTFKKLTKKTPLEFRNTSTSDPFFTIL